MKGGATPRGAIPSILARRAAALAAAREFFAQRGFLEVETPAVVEAPGQEAHLQPRQLQEGGWLVTSPEHHMKRLLARGQVERIYQVCRCFRGGERSALHRPEFTMVEWYRAGVGYGQIAADVEELVAHVALAVSGSAVVARDGEEVDLRPPWPRLAVADAFRRWAGVSLAAGGEVDTLRREAREAGCISIDDGDDWESAFHKLLVERVEPGLRRLGQGVHLLDYPAPLAGLARLKADDPSLAERVESYAGGLELANGFGELTDPRQQRRRFRQERETRRRLGRSVLPVDEAFLRCLVGRGGEGPLPPSAGVALGFDRLVMLATGAGRIDDVIAFWV